MHGVALLLEHPEFCALLDMDKEASIASRKSVIEQVKKQGLTMYGMHFPTKDGVKVKWRFSRFYGYDEGMRIASLFSWGYSIVLLIIHLSFVIQSGVKDLENIKDGEKELFIL